MVPIDEPCAPDAIECSGGGGGGGYIPPSFTFISTEMAMPYNTAGRTSAGGTGQRINSDWDATTNPQGFLYDLKIVKGTGAGEPPFNDNPKYRNLGVDLNKGAGGLYIYVSFTRDPASIEYQATGRDEREFDYSVTPARQIHRPITNVMTQATNLGKPSDFYPPDRSGVYSPMWA